MPHHQHAGGSSSLCIRVAYMLACTGKANFTYDALLHAVWSESVVCQEVRKGPQAYLEVALLPLQCAPSKVIEVAKEQPYKAKGMLF